jgi:hypothetical protein
MVYLVGGYKLTEEHVRAWSEPRGIVLWENAYMVSVNRWLQRNGIRTRLLACDYEGECIFLVVTHEKVAPDSTPTKFKPFVESERSLKVKRELEIGDVEFVTIVNPYPY